MRDLVEVIFELIIDEDVGYTLGKHIVQSRNTGGAPRISETAQTMNEPVDFLETA